MLTPLNMDYNCKVSFIGNKGLKCGIVRILYQWFSNHCETLVCAVKHKFVICYEKLSGKMPKYVWEMLTYTKVSMFLFVLI